MYSIVVPVYLNQHSLNDLLSALDKINLALYGDLEAVFVVDGSPDDSYALLVSKLPAQRFRSKLCLLSRNFGAFAAIRAGLQEASGPYFAVMAADLQEPPELATEFFKTLENEPIDVVIGARRSRDDPLSSRLSSALYWFVYRKLVQPDLPVNGMDVFGCNQVFRDRLLEIEESNTSLVGLVYWLGFRRKTIEYTRQRRTHGKSAWTLRKKAKYMMDSIYAFSDLPVRLSTMAGLLGLVTSVILAAVVLTMKLSGEIPVPGYAATAVMIMFFGSLNIFILGIIGSYVWRAYENTKRRALGVVMNRHNYAGIQGDEIPDTPK